MKFKTGDKYILQGASQRGYTRNGDKIIINPYDVIVKIRDNFADKIHLRNMWRIEGTLYEVDIHWSIVNRYFTECVTKEV